MSDRGMVGDMRLLAVMHSRMLKLLLAERSQVSVFVMLHPDDVYDETLLDIHAAWWSLVRVGKWDR